MLKVVVGGTFSRKVLYSDAEDSVWVVGAFAIVFLRPEACAVMTAEAIKMKNSAIYSDKSAACDVLQFDLNLRPKSKSPLSSQISHHNLSENKQCQGQISKVPSLPQP